VFLAKLEGLGRDEVLNNFTEWDSFSNNPLRNVKLRPACLMNGGLPESLRNKHYHHWVSVC
jgi:hypothetical protein